nr:hypothetical protein [Tetrasphaera sp. HKS02]
MGDDHADRPCITLVNGMATQPAPHPVYPLANEDVSDLVRSALGWLAQVVPEVAYPTPYAMTDLAVHDHDDTSYRFSWADITCWPRIAFGKFR